MPWYATGGAPTAQREAAALAELAEITAGRTDLLTPGTPDSISHCTTPGQMHPPTSVPFSFALRLEPT
jgi:hypothetical protein